MTRVSRDAQMLMQAMVTSLRSTCGRRQVGAIIALDGRVISSGYAGPPSGHPHCDHRCFTASNAMGGCNRTIHAEANAIAYAARHGISTTGATLYCTLSPCRECAKIIISSGIKRVCYLEAYRDLSGVNLLQESGIVCETQIAIYAHFAKCLQMSALLEPGIIPQK